MIENKSNKISIVIPCHNEEGNIVFLYDSLVEMLNELQGFNYEIVFIDDKSSDKTLERIQKISEKDKRVKYISFSRNFGHQSALRAGFENATGDCIVCMDGDMQHPVNIIPIMVEKWLKGFDIVYSIRKDTKEASLFKKTTSKLFYKILNRLSEIEIEEGAADFRLIDKKIQKILIENFSEYHLFYRGLISWIGFNQIGVEYTPNARFSGETKYSFLKMLNFAINGITSFSVKPLKLAILLGMLTSLFAAIYGGYTLFVALFTDDAVTGWSSIIISVLFIGGINMVLLGIISEYLGKLYFETKKRPVFLIDKTNIDK